MRRPYTYISRLMAFIDPAPTGELPLPTVVDRRRNKRYVIPSSRALLTAVLSLRLVLLLVLFMWVRTSGGPITWVIQLFGMLAGIWLMWQLRPGARVYRPPPWAVLLQAIVDVLLVTALIAAEGTDATSLAALYIALLAIYALLLPLGRALFVVVLVLASYTSVTLLYNRVGTPGSDFWVQLTVVTGVGALVAILGHRLAAAALDQQALAEALRQARLEAEEILGTIQSGVMTVDSAGVLRYLNPRARDILGLGGAGLIPGKPVLAALQERSQQLHDAILRGISDGVRISRGEVTVLHEDGSPFPVGLSTTTFERPGSDGMLVTGIFTDISDLKRLQEFRLRAERLEAVAALSASLAHEIRNPLAAIRSAVEQLAQGAAEDDDERILANLVMRESERLNRLLSEFLDFSRVRATAFRRLDLNEVVRDAVQTVRGHPAAEGIEISLDGAPLTVEADTDLVHRMVSNLVLNAVQALGGGGQVSVRIQRVDTGEIPRGQIVRPIRLTISDNGPGIPQSVQDHLFEPFVTGRIGGTGLGLPIVQRAVAAHRGIILVDTDPESGTTFTIFLPETWNGEAMA